MNTTAEYYLNNSDLVGFPKFGWNFDISPTAFTVFGLEIKWYGILIAIGMLLAMMYCFKRIKEFGLDSDRVIDAVVFGLIGAMIGARAYYVIFDADVTFAEFFRFRDGGLAIYGGLIGGLLVGGIAAKIRKVKILPLFDLAAAGFVIGQAVGRWGNFVNKEAFGSQTSLPWGMSSASIQYMLAPGSDTLVMAHPCFLYESLWCILGFILIHFYIKHRKFDGEIFLMYSAWYGFGRFFIEGLRTDSLYLGLIRVSQLLAIICVVIAVFLIIFIRGKVKRYPESFVLYKDTEESKKLIEESEKKNAKVKTEVKSEEKIEVTEEKDDGKNN
ncbi:MAG TPA: prolipoprotein diacylglyceryl transferase [Oscillospiraceae bacterium]|nr:prolipoprotein diacylglyceryl transferase [Oscillospiraceae bacterium]